MPRVEPEKPKGKKTKPLPLFDSQTQEGAAPIGQAMAVSSTGMGVRFELGAFQEPSTRLGRKFMKVKDGEEVVNIGFLQSSLKSSIVAVASQRGRMLLCPTQKK